MEEAQPMWFRRESRALTNPLHILVTEEPDGHFAAHCLELDLIGEAPTQDQALDDIEAVIRTAIEYAIDNDNLDHLYKPAPAEYWNALAHATLLGERRIRIDVPARPRVPRSQYEGFLYSAAGAACYA